jgi:hypothetical protein
LLVQAARDGLTFERDVVDRFRGHRDRLTTLPISM